MTQLFIGVVALIKHEIEGFWFVVQQISENDSFLVNANRFI